MTEPEIYTWGIVFPIPDEPPVDDALFLKSICTFGAMLRWRVARGLYQNWWDNFENEPLRMAMACGIFQEAGSQLEDLLMFLIAVPNWLSQSQNTRLADIYSKIQVRSTGPTSPSSVAGKLRQLSDKDFLKNFGLPVDPNRWLDRGDRNTMRETRLRLIKFLEANVAMRQALNKIKHGPQLVVTNAFEARNDPTMAEITMVKLLLSGSKLAMASEYDDQTHINLEDQGPSIKRVVDAIETAGREICVLALYVHYFTFGSWPDKNPQFNPPVQWIDLKRFPSEEIW